MGKTTTHRILITSLYGGVSGGKLRYYYTKKDDKVLYCDALISAEASCKYVLANHRIDEIVTFGSKSTFDEGDGLKPLLLKDGSAFYASDIRNMSTYSLFRYRLAEYLDEIDIEEQDIRELLSEEEQEQMSKLIEEFFYKTDNSEKTQHFNRFFNHLMQDINLRDSFISNMEEKFPETKKDPKKYLKWIYRQLYNEMKSSYKLELLEENSEVMIRFIPVGEEENGVFIENFSKIMREIKDVDNSEIELYICIQSDDASDMFVLTNLINLVNAMPDAHIKVARVITTTRNPEEVVALVSDDTLKFSISDLVSGTRAFMQYGKTDMLLGFWQRMGVENDDVERLLYAMRNIDYGISLCDISDIERGITSLRNLFKEVRQIKSETFVDKYFDMIATGIKRDYGSLVESDDIIFIDLVKWAYRKGFWQQTLTLIESRAADAFVDNGFFYYSNSPEATEEAKKVFAQLYYDLKPYEKYKLEEISHYYIKYYNRGGVPHTNDQKSNQMAYANLRISELTTDDPRMIKAYSICPDKDALRDLLFAYYYIGDVRNATNHALEEFGGFSSVMHDSDVSERMNTIVQSIDYFIHCYDKVEELIKQKGNKPDVNKLELSDMIACSKKLKPHFNNHYNNGNYNGNNNRNNGNYNGNNNRNNGNYNGNNNNNYNRNNNYNNNNGGNNGGNGNYNRNGGNNGNNGGNGNYNNGNGGNNNFNRNDNNRNDNNRNDNNADSDKR